MNEMKSGKAPGLDGFPEERLKKGGMTVLEYLVRQLNLNFDMGVVPTDRHGACIVPLYKEKGNKCECSNSRNISLLSVVGKLYGKVLITRVRVGTECTIGEEQCWFRQGRGCMDQVFAVRQVCEKYLANGKDVFWVFMDSLKAYDTINQHGMWQMLRVYGIGGKLLNAVQSFYIDSKERVWVGNDVGEWFKVNVGLRQGCVMSTWLFNVYMDGVVREVNVRVLGKGLELLSANDGRFEIKPAVICR